MDNPSLADQVFDLLRKKKPELGDNFRRKFQGKSKTVSGELKELNDFFRIELSELAMKTREERSVLRDDLAPTMWIMYFEKYVLPAMVRFDVPKG